MKTDTSDPVIDETREVRHRISERLNHDPIRVVHYYMELQRQYEDRLIDSHRPASEKERSASEPPGSTGPEG